MLHELNKYVTTFLHYNQNTGIRDSSKAKSVVKHLQLLPPPPPPPQKKREKNIPNINSPIILMLQGEKNYRIKRSMFLSSSSLVPTLDIK